MSQQLEDTLIGLLSRKFILSVAALFIVSFALPVPAETKLAFITGIVGIFSAANVVQKIANPQRMTVTEKTVTPTATTEKTVEKPSGEAVPPG